MKTLPAALLSSSLVLAQAAADRPTVHMVGDSTMADKPNPATNPERGWGQMLPRFFSESVTVRNHAVNGRSTRSFISEGKWDAVVGQLKAGDYVLIQFGHNDQKSEDSSRFTNPHTGYRRNLERFVAESRAKGATPVLFSSIVRRNFSAQGVLLDTHGAYPQVARDVAREHGVPFIDLQSLSEELVLRAGVEGSKGLYVWTASRQDNTHLSVKGATEIARLAAAAIKRADLPLARQVRGLD